MTRSEGTAGDADYGRIGDGYTNFRQPEPEFEAAIAVALGGASTVLNVGAGAGSYEPVDREVTAVEPSPAMRAQRPPHLVEAIEGTAESLPFPDAAFDAAMTTFSVHQWKDLAAGLAQMRRVHEAILGEQIDPANFRRDMLAQGQLVDTGRVEQGTPHRPARLYRSKDQPEQ